MTLVGFLAILSSREPDPPLPPGLHPGKEKAVVLRQKESTGVRTHTHTYTHINTSKTKQRIPHSCTHVKSHALLVAGASNSVTIQAVDLVAFKGFLQIRRHFPTWLYSTQDALVSVHNDA